MRPGVTPDAIKRWAKGIKHDAVREDELDPDNPGPDDMLEDGEIEPGEHNALWSGEDPRTPEELEAMDEIEAEEFNAWLQEHEPEIFEAVTALSGALESMDVEGAEIAKQQLLSAQQFLDPEYPPLDPAQREVIAQQIAAHQGEGPRGIAVSVAMARKPAAPEEVIEDEEALTPPKPPAQAPPNPGMPPRGGMGI